MKKAELVSVTPEAEKLLVEIARVSSSREDKSADSERLINYLINNKHWSPFEHSYMTIKIVTSKVIAIQFLRHRSFTFQEFSQRYAKVTDLTDIDLRLQATKNRQSSTNSIGGITFKEHNNKQDFYLSDHTLAKYQEVLSEVGENLKDTQKLYDKMIDKGIAKECARMILPMASQTTLYMTGNIRSWIHFLMLRDDSHAQLEAQIIAKEIKEICKEQFPLTYKALNWDETEGFKIENYSQEMQDAINALDPELRKVVETEGHLHELKIVDGELFWKLSVPDSMYTKGEYSINDLMGLYQQLGYDKNSEEVRHLYRSIGYSIFRYWEKFYWNANNDNAESYQPPKGAQVKISNK